MRLPLIALTLILGLLHSPSQAADGGLLEGEQTLADFAYLKDITNDVLLFSKAPHARMYPASMTKIMTAYIAFLKLKAGIIELDDKVVISARAHRMGGSKMFLPRGKAVRVEDLLRGIIVQSGNDASIALAEYISGSEDNFAALMNSTAREIGMIGSNFVNASGWPNDNHYTTAADLAILTERLISEFPVLYRMFAEETFTFSKITQKNRNTLLGENNIDGVKTGHTQASGYGVVSSAEINGRRLVLVVNGLDSIREREAETRRLIKIGFRGTVFKKVFRPGQTIVKIPLWYGEKRNVEAISNQPITVTMRRSDVGSLKATVAFKTPLKAPIEANTPIATLSLQNKDEVFAEYPLYARDTMERAGYFVRIQDNINFLIWGRAR